MYSIIFQKKAGKQILKLLYFVMIQNKDANTKILHSFILSLFYEYFDFFRFETFFKNSCKKRNKNFSWFISIFLRELEFKFGWKLKKFQLMIKKAR
jgi:hypothetical protein